MAAALTLTQSRRKPSFTPTKVGAELAISTEGRWQRPTAIAPSKHKFGNKIPGLSRAIIRPVAFALISGIRHNGKSEISDGAFEMERVEDFSDMRLKTRCIHCGEPLSRINSTEDHVPTKSFLDKPRPHNLPVVEICVACNNRFSKDEQYLTTFLSCVVSGSTDPERQTNESAARALHESPSLRAMIESAKTIELLGSSLDTAPQRLVWQPDIARINRITVKNARGHVYFELGDVTQDEPANVLVRPFATMTVEEERDFESSGSFVSEQAWPEVGSRMMTRMAQAIAANPPDMIDGWIIVQPGRYRYQVDASGPLVKSVIWEYLTTEVYWED